MERLVLNRVKFSVEIHILDIFRYMIFLQDIENFQYARMDKLRVYWIAPSGGKT